MAILTVKKQLGWFDIKKGLNKGKGIYLRVDLRDQFDNSIWLNLPEEKLFKQCSDWLPYLRSGNVLACDLQPNGANVDYNKGFKVIKEMEKI